MTPSKYQQSIYDHIGLLCQDRAKNLIVQAVAGSGKTTTIREACKKIPQSMSVLFLAFNKHIAETLQKSLPSHVRASTLNSAGWQACLRYLPMPPRLEPKKTEIFYASLFNFEDSKESSIFYKNKYNVSRIISLLKAAYNFTPTNYDVEAIALNHGIELDSKMVVDILRTFHACIQEHSILDFDDQIFMPVFLNLDVPQFDLVMVDEAQDLNPVMALFIQKMSKRFVCVGDSRQAIYGFRGADPESMDNLKKALDADELPLSICYRCPKKVIAEAQKIVPHIEASESAEDGTNEDIKQEDFRKNIKAGDYVLCRTTAPLVSECLKAIRNKISASVKGRDIGQNLIELVKSANCSPRDDISAFMSKFKDSYNNKRTKLVSLEKDDLVQVLDDQFDTIEVLCEDSETVEDLNRLINTIFSDNQNPASMVIFCTVHRSKGLEAENIYILNRELMPHPSAKQNWQMIQEMNLKYVAVTRSLKNLYWVKS